MLKQLRENCKEIISLIGEAEKNEGYKRRVISFTQDLKNKLSNGGITKEEYEKTLSRFLKGYEENRLLSLYDQKISEILKKARKKNDSLKSFFPKEEIKNTKKVKTAEIKELGLDKEYVKEIVSNLNNEEDEIAKYKIYKTNFYAKISNSVFEWLSFSLIKKFPEFFETLFASLRSSNIKILSKTYVSTMLLTTFLSFLVAVIIFPIIVSGGVLTKVIVSFLLAILLSISIFTLMYYAPYFSASSKKRRIKEDLPFVVIHMSAIASSGAQPIAMFNILLDSKEYTGIKSEIRKIVNYVNLMGYDLNTSLKNVAITTPSKPFRELLNGIVSTIESGGSLKQYLDAKAEDLMGTYRLDRKKYVETISAYSDIYTGILIAAPLLFFVTLAIIQLLGGEIFGVSVNLIAIVGTYAVIPLLNGVFLIFLNTIQLKE